MCYKFSLFLVLIKNIDTPITKGPSETYQMWLHDPDGNKFEIMQFTDKSIQVVGNYHN